MKTRIKIALCGLLILAAVVLSGELAKSFEAAAAGTPAATQPSAQVSAGQSATAAAYVVGGYDGSVAVFVSGQKTPQTVTNIPLDSLRETDRLSVETGIPVASYEELQQLLEDFGS